MIEEELNKNEYISSNGGAALTVGIKNTVML